VLSPKDLDRAGVRVFEIPRRSEQVCVAQEPRSRDAPAPASTLAAAFVAGRASSEALGRESDREAMRVQLELRRSLMACELAIESWIDDWHRAGT
jgi:hypothetical protein